MYSPPAIMALPPWAYQQRQQLSPIRIEASVEAVQRSAGQAVVRLRILSVVRNRSTVPLRAGDRIPVQVQIAPLSPANPHHPPAAIGAPQAVPTIPPVGQHVQAWLRPSLPPSGTFELMAGPYGFGPDLEQSADP